MKLASFERDGWVGFGVITDDGLLAADCSNPLISIKNILGLSPSTLRSLADRWPRIELGTVRLLPPITDPTLIVGIGLNTKSHFEETAELMKRTPGDYPSHPRLFLRTSDSHVGHGATLLIPRPSHQLDYEGEIAIIIGKEGRNISEQDALS